MTPAAYPFLTAFLPLACAAAAIVALWRAARRIDDRKRRRTIRLPIPPPDIIARELHELMRLNNPACPACQDLDPKNARHADIIRLARTAACVFVSVAEDGPAAPPTRSALH